jgi:hypothetical protein
MTARRLARNALMLMVTGLLIATRASAADRQIRPFIGATFGGGTTFLDTEQAIGKPHLAIGASAVFLGEIFGTEIDVFDAPGFFQAGDKNLVHVSHVATFSGNVVLAAPRRLTEYFLRPYMVGGATLMLVRTTTALSVFDVSTVRPAFDIGVGAVAFVTNKVGVSWDVRRFQTIGDGNPPVGLSFGDEHLSFWRATMAAVIRY